VTAVTTSSSSSPSDAANAGPALDRSLTLALGCVDRATPFQTVHRVDREDDRSIPRERHPVFYGCFDWHSAVHAHWTLARALGRAPSTARKADARRALDRRLDPDALAQEAAYLRSHPGFERPYGLAWLLALDAEVHRLAESDEQASEWANRLAPPVEAAVEGLASWLEKLPRPIRSGVHSQSAFAMSLVLDWARTRRQQRMASLVGRRALDFHLADRALPLHLEPSGEDFLSPSLGAADLLRRVLAPADLGGWLEAALPDLPRGDEPPPDWLVPVKTPDPTDGRLAHLQGLSLSRAWMLRGLARALPDGDPRRPGLRAAADLHASDGLATLAGDAYAGTHWLGTFVTYLVTDAWCVPRPGGIIAPP